MTSTWDRARAVADAVLYEGYLLYPYRGTSSKNQSRWQFGVLGPPGAAAAGLGEDDTLAAQFLVDGAQQAPHLPTDVTALGIDFFGCTGHKMLGPTGIDYQWNASAELVENMLRCGWAHMAESICAWRS